MSCFCDFTSLTSFQLRLKDSLLSYGVNVSANLASLIPFLDVHTFLTVIFVFNYFEFCNYLDTKKTYFKLLSTHAIEFKCSASFMVLAKLLGYKQSICLNAGLNYAY